MKGIKKFVNNRLFFYQEALDQSLIEALDEHFKGKSSRHLTPITFESCGFDHLATLRARENRGSWVMNPLTVVISSVFDRFN